MLNDLSPQQRELENYMSELSEHAYSAGWMDGLEFALGKLFIDVPTNTVSSSFHDQFEETSVPMNKWLEIFKAAARLPDANGLAGCRPSADCALP